MGLSFAFENLMGKGQLIIRPPEFREDLGGYRKIIRYMLTCTVMHYVADGGFAHFIHTRQLTNSHSGYAERPSDALDHSLGEFCSGLPLAARAASLLGSVMVVVCQGAKE